MNYLFLTGSNGQIGRSICHHFISKGWKIVGMDTSDQSTHGFIDCYVQGSVTSRCSFAKLFTEALKCPIDKKTVTICLINNAGVAVFTPSEERTKEEFDQVVDTNLLGPLYGMTEFKKFFVDHKPDILFSSKDLKLSVVNISSVYGVLAPNNTIYTDTARNSSEIYGATKAGLIQMTKYFAVRYSPFRINVNGLAPGGVLNNQLQGSEFIQNYSNLVPMKRMCMPEEVASAAFFLAEGQVEYLNGQTILLDGALSAW